MDSAKMAKMPVFKQKQANLSQIEQKKSALMVKF
jgi:hypothetical protein